MELEAIIDLKDDIKEEIGLLRRDILYDNTDKQKFYERSPAINELMSALAKAQAEMRIAGKDSNNPYFKSKYADLASIVAASRPFLTKNGLCVMQQLLLNEEGKRMLVTILGHSSGQYVTSRLLLLTAKEDIQSLGSAITYMRRYAYASLVGVIADDEDDDGESAMKSVRQPTNGYKNGYSHTGETISQDQKEILKRDLPPDLEQSLLNHYGYASLDEIPRERFATIHERVLKIKRDRESKA